MSDSDSDAQLVERAREGDTGAFEALVRRHLRSAYAVALAVLLDPQDAEDAAQDALISALERLEQCRNPALFGAWLRQIVRNRARNLHRARTLRRVLPLASALEVPAPHDPGRDAERGQIRGRLLEGLQQLSEVHREVLLLHDLEGLRHREIADALAIPEGTVRSHLFYARRAIRKFLGAGLLREE